MKKIPLLIVISFLIIFYGYAKNEITLEDTLKALQFDQYQVEVPEELRLKAKASIDRMLEYV